MSQGYWGWQNDYFDYEEPMDEGPSLSLLAKWHDEGRCCGECQAEFVNANGVPSCCQTCKNMGSELPLSKYEEKNVEAHKQQARKRRKEKSNVVDEA